MDLKSIIDYVLETNDVNRYSDITRVRRSSVYILSKTTFCNIIDSLLEDLKRECNTILLQTIFAVGDFVVKVLSVYNEEELKSKVENVSKEIHSVLSSTNPDSAFSKLVSDIETVYREILTYLYFHSEKGYCFSFWYGVVDPFDKADYMFKLVAYSFENPRSNVLQAIKVKTVQNKETKIYDIERDVNLKPISMVDFKKAYTDGLENNPYIRFENDKIYLFGHSYTINMIIALFLYNQVYLNINMDVFAFAHYEIVESKPIVAKRPAEETCEKCGKVKR